MTSHASHKQYDDQSDEPLDPVEGADSGFAQTIGEELREVTSNTDGALNIKDDAVTELEDFEPAQPSALSTLKALAARGKEAKAAQSALKASDPLAALLSRVREKVAEEAGIKDDRRRAAGVLDAGGLNQAQREALRAKILKWEAEREWTPTACLFVQEITMCSGCGHKHEGVYGLFERQTRRLTNAEVSDGKLPSERLVRWCPEDLNEPGLKDLPRQWTARERAVSVCTNCVLDKGFVSTTIDWEHIK